MFRIGEFAQIAQVSTRQLRFYDQLELLQPNHTDTQTGYRYYSIRQLPQLNRILALKELGLSLDQIGPLLRDGLSPSELRAMLTMKRAQVEQVLQDEEARLRHIESRIAQLDKYGAIDGFDVVTKSITAAHYLSLHCKCSGMEEAVRMVQNVATEAAKQLKPGLIDKFVVVSQNEYETDTLDLEIGYTLSRPTNTIVRVAGDLALRMAELPACSTMATIVRQGTSMENHVPFSAIGMWIEANNYEIVGPCREVFLEPVVGPPGFDKVLVEIQFPIQLAA